MRKWMAATCRTGLLTAACLAVVAPVYAQGEDAAGVGSVRGIVVDDAGTPVAGATVTLQIGGESPQMYEVVSGPDGAFAQDGMKTGAWLLIAETDGASGYVANVAVPAGGAADTGSVMVRTGFEVPDSPAEEIGGLFDSINLALDAGDSVAAMNALETAAERVYHCSECYLRMGDIYFEDGADDEAESAYLQAIEYDDTLAAAHDGLAALYNRQQRFEEAGQASARANELRAASGEAQDATSLFNAGAILVNSGDMAGAQAQFEQAIAADPTMAEAYYQLAMTLVNQGNVVEAVPALEQYLELAPDGPNAATAEMMLPELQKMMPQ